MQNVRALAIEQQEEEYNQVQEEDVLFGIRQFRDRVISSAKITNSDMQQKIQKVRINKINRKHLPPIIPGPLEGK